MRSLVPNDSLAALRDLFAEPRRIAIVTHYNPDGDALGCSLGLSRVLRSIGHDVQVLLPNTPPASLHWMPGYGEAIPFDREPQRCTDAIAACDALLCMDFNRTDRVKGLEAALVGARLKVLIDHHQQPADFAQIVFSDVNACATSQMVFDLLEQLDLADRIDRDAAICLYTGIMTDSGSFRFSSTTPHTFRVAAKLMDRGVDVDQVYAAVMEENNESRLRLIGFALTERMEVLHDLRTAIFKLDRRDLSRFQYQPGDTEGLVNEGLSIRGIRLSAYFMERSGGVKVSLRSKGRLPVDRLCRDLFGGGGHANAAGADVAKGMGEVVEMFRAALPAFISAHPE